MAAPCALFASCTDFNPGEIVKQILNVDSLPDGRHIIEKIQAFPWHIDTKYYTADIDICTTDSKTIGNQEFAESAQAVILYFNSKEVSSFDQVNSWIPFLKEICPAVQMLVCENCTNDTAVSRQRVLKWCLENAFELVELNPALESEGELEDDFGETTGIKRIIQALHAHTWPNLVMKENPTFRSPYFEQMMVQEKVEKDALSKQGDAIGNTNTNKIDYENTSAVGAEGGIQTSDSLIKTDSNNASAIGVEYGTAKSHGEPIDGSTSTDGAKNKTNKESSMDRVDALVAEEDLSLLTALGGEGDPDNETFEQLFTKMRLMKEKAETLSPEERKAYAEKVAISFWKAIGGDEDEIEGLDSDGYDGMD